MVPPPGMQLNTIQGKPAMRENSMEELHVGPKGASYGSNANLASQLNGNGAAADMQSQASMRPMYDDNGRPLRV